jgi:hypothetical protein
MTNYELEEEILEYISDLYGRDCSWKTALIELNNYNFIAELSNVISCDKTQLIECVNNLIKLAKNNIIDDKKSDMNEDFE